MNIERLEVEGLFDRLDYVVHFRGKDPTILTAPNGAGKTHILRLATASLSLDPWSLSTMPFKQLQVFLREGNALRVTRESSELNGEFVAFQALDESAHPVGEIVAFDSEILHEMRQDLPSHLLVLGNGDIYDTRIDRIMPPEIVKRRYGSREAEIHKHFANAPEILEVCSGPRPVFIDTKRLETFAPNHSVRGDAERLPRHEENQGASRIVHYIRQLQAQVAEARRLSIQATQSADLSFAARALEAAARTVRDNDLHERYDQIVELYEDLARNSLAVDTSEPLTFPERTNPTSRRILDVFLDDWVKRLEPLLPMNEKIKTLRSILDSKLMPSGKYTRMSQEGKLEFRDPRGEISVASLSSGEQHLVALFTMLLFSADQGSVVLIDEPEISLHAAWKHAFLADISLVAKLSGLQIVLATHSTAIINGRWDLTEELLFANEHGG